MKTIYVHGQAVSVSDDVYKAYWQEVERERYGTKRFLRRHYALSDLEARGAGPDYILPPAPSAEERTFMRLRHLALHQALDTLTPSEREFIWALTLHETTERAMAERLGLSRSGVHKKKHRLLKKLRAHLLAHAPDFFK